MRKWANISPYMRRPLVIYDFATAPFWISLYIWGKFDFLFYQCAKKLFLQNLLLFQFPGHCKNKESRKYVAQYFKISDVFNTKNPMLSFIFLQYIVHAPKLRRSASSAQQDFPPTFFAIFFEGEVLVLWYRCEPPRHLLHLPALVPPHPSLLRCLHHVRCNSPPPSPTRENI